jgi:hypothetical protein
VSPTNESPVKFNAWTGVLGRATDSAMNAATARNLVLALDKV